MLVRYSHNNSICPRILTQFYLIRCWEARITWCSRFFGRSFCRLLFASRTVLMMGPLGAISGCEGCSIPTSLAYCYHTFGWSSSKNHHQILTHLHVHSFTTAGHLGNFYKSHWIRDSRFWRMINMWYEPSCSQMFDATQLLLTYFCSNALFKELVPIHIKHMVNLRQSSQLCERATTGCSFRIKRNHNETAQVLIPQMQNHLE